MAAISVEGPDETKKLAKELNIDFPVLSDPTLEVANAYGVAMEGEDLAIPSVFVMDRKLRIHWRKVGITFKDRPPVEDILAAVDEAASVEP